MTSRIKVNCPVFYQRVGVEEWRRWAEEVVQHWVGLETRSRWIYRWAGRWLETPRTLGKHSPFAFLKWVDHSTTTRPSYSCQATFAPYHAFHQLGSSGPQTKKCYHTVPCLKVNSKPLHQPFFNGFTADDSDLAPWSTCACVDPFKSRSRVNFPVKCSSPCVSDSIMTDLMILFFLSGKPVREAIACRILWKSMLRSDTFAWWAITMKERWTLGFRTWKMTVHKKNPLVAHSNANSNSALVPKNIANSCGNTENFRVYQIAVNDQDAFENHKKSA